MQSIFPAPDASVVVPTTGTSAFGAPAELTQQILAAIVEVVSSIRCSGSGRLVKLGVSMTQMHVLWVLQHHGDLPMSGVADLLDVSLSNATGIIDRMEEHGLIERGRVPDDRRVVLVRLADGGRRALEEIEAIRQDRLTAILGHLAPAQLASLADALTAIRTVIEADESFEHQSHSHPHA